MNRPLEILHLSDLHLDKTSLRDQRVVLNALFNDIRSTVATNGAYDLVFFTGDLILKGAYTEDNKSAVVSEFLMPLIDAAGIQPDRLVLTPGNHDVDLKSQSSILAKARLTLCSEDDVAKYLDEATSASLATGLEGFNSIVEKLAANESMVLSNNHYRAYVLNINGISVGVGALNTAWNATGAPSDGDYGKLRVGRKQMDEVVEAISKTQVKLAIFHHPVSWLSPKESQNIQRQLMLHFDAYFHGHNHEPYAQVSTGSSSACFMSNAGCLYQHRDYFNGYCSIRHIPIGKRWTVKAREYYETRQVFDMAPRFANNGVEDFVRTGEGVHGTLSVLPTDEYIESINATFNSRLLPSLVSDVAPKNLRSIFVEPLLSRVSQRKIDASNKNGSAGIFVPLKQVLLLERSVVLLGNRDIGKTTLLHRICQLSLEYGMAEMTPFGAYVNLEVVGDTMAALVAAVVSFCGGAYRKSEITGLLKHGVTVCFDNLVERRDKQFKAVQEFCQTFNGCRYYFTMLEDVDYSLSPNKVPKIVANSEVFYLHPFGRRETRILTQNWFGASAEECAGRVDDILSLLGRLNVPRSPFLISALLWISEKGTQFSPVNQAEILDALVDGVMEKLSETKDRSRLDSTIKRHYLAALAEHLHASGRKSIPILELERFTVDYFESRGLVASIGSFLSDLKAKGILLEIGDEATFMFEAIRAFFLSTRLHENKALLDEALSKEHFLELGEELDYYTGRHRDQDQVLKAVMTLVQEFLLDANLNIHLSEFDKIRINENPIDGESEQKLRSSALQSPNEQTRALLELLDEQVGSQVSAMPSHASRYNVGASGVGRYLEALRIASSILRNSELVQDVALKEQSYSEFADGWCRILIGVMAVLDDNGDHSISPTIDEKGKDPVLHLLEGLLPSDNPGMAKYLKKLIVPNVIMSLALESIGTTKLALIMEKHHETAGATVQRVLDVFLMTDLRLPNWTQHLDDLLRQFHRNRFVCELVFSKLFQVFMLGRLRANEEQKVRGLLAESLTLVVSEDRARYKTRMKGTFLANLVKRRLTRR